jgi:hypothetical protein
VAALIQPPERDRSEQNVLLLPCTLVAPREEEPWRASHYGHFEPDLSGSAARNRADALDSQLVLARLQRLD